MRKVLFVILMLMCISIGASAARCKAITNAGKQCSRVAKIHGYCTQHYNIQLKKQHNPGYEQKVKQVSDPNGKPKKATSDANQCIATTKKGTRCKLQALPGTKYCWTHTQ